MSTNSYGSTIIQQNAKYKTIESGVLYSRTTYANKWFHNFYSEK